MKMIAHSTYQPAKRYKMLNGERVKSICFKHWAQITVVSVLLPCRIHRCSTYGAALVRSQPLLETWFAELVTCDQKEHPSKQKKKGGGTYLDLNQSERVERNAHSQM